MRGNIIKKRLMSFAFEKTPRMSLSHKLIPIQCREYERGPIQQMVVVMTSVNRKFSSQTWLHVT